MIKRAKVGGEIGANGAAYKGGQFINTVADNPKGEAAGNAKPERKREVAPYVWEVAPDAGMIPLRVTFDSFAKFDRETQTYALRTDAGLAETLAYYGKDERDITPLIAAFNSGQRWTTAD